MKLDHSDLQLVRDRIHAAKRYNEDKLVKARRTERMRQWFSGDHFNPDSAMSKILESDRIVVNYSLINVLVKVANIAYGDPSFRVKATRMGYDTHLDKLVLDNTWKEIGATQATRAALFDCKVVGTGVVATNWRVETARMVYQDQSEPAEPVVYDNPEVRRLKPEWWLVDPDHPEDWRKGWYAGERWRLPLHQMRKSPRYEHLGDKLKGLIKPDYADGAPTWGEGPSETRDENLRQVEGYTLYLRDLGLVVDWCEELPNEPLWVGDANYYPVDPQGRPYFPYAMLSNIPLVDTHFGLSDIEVTETQQAEIDIARSQLAMIRRQNNGQMGVVKGLLDDTNKEVIQSGVAGALVELELATIEDVRKGMMMLPRDTAPQEVYTSLDKAQMDMSEISRASSFRRGMAVPGVKYATEAALIQQGQQGLEADERTLYERFVAETGEQVHWLLKRWGRDVRQVELAKPDDETGEGWVEYTSKQLTPYVKCLVEPASMNPPDSALEEGKWSQRMQLLVPLTQMGFNIRPVAEAYLHSFDFSEVEEALASLGMQPMMPPGMPGAVPPGPEGETGGEVGPGNEASNQGGVGAPEAAGVGAGLPDSIPPQLLAAITRGLARQ